MSEGIEIQKPNQTKRPVLCLNLGKTNYTRALELQNDLVNAKKNNVIKYDRIILTEHSSCFTLGKRGGKENLAVSDDFLKLKKIKVIQTTRGGNITYHGPGQIILYPIIDLNALKIDIPTFVNRLEQVMILTCENFGIKAERNNKNPGIWVGNAKLGSIGISLKQGISFHGLALNVNPDLTPFSWMNPCGLNDIEITSIEKELLKTNFNSELNINEVKKAIISNFESIFNFDLRHKYENTMPGIKSDINGANNSRIKPSWLKRNLPKSAGFEKVRNILNNENLNTVCQSANCPNKWECFCSGTSTFMILGNQCTRNCRFCNITPGIPLTPDSDEPVRVANAAKKLELNYIVITSVTRDDLPDGGALLFAQTISQIKNKMGGQSKIEVLIPDFKGDKKALKTVLDAKPDVLNHNIETVPSLYKTARPEADYNQSLKLFSNSLKIDSSIPVKSGIMVGLGETYAELFETMNDLFKSGCSMLTIGQYLQPSKEHLSVKKYYSPDEFTELEKLAKKIGFAEVASGPFVRSSYKAEELLNTL
ncbi:MAG: lipoyl synthase [Desulfobacteraceae bacterium]|nr:lipoyl synthase [Desulfobacteraceae bacterium]